MKNGRNIEFIDVYLDSHSLQDIEIFNSYLNLSFVQKRNKLSFYKMKQGLSSLFIN